MEKRALLAIALSIAVMVVWQMYFAPPIPEAPQLADPNAEGMSASGVEVPSQMAGAAGGPQEGASAPGDAEGTTHEAAPPGAPSSPRIEAPSVEEFRVKTARHDVRLTNQGGRVLWWRLPEYTRAEDVPVEL